MSTTTTLRRNQNTQNRSFRNFMWISMLMSLAVVFFGMQLMMVGPLKGRLDAIQTRLDLTDQNLEVLVGTSDDVQHTNSLLADLEAQADRFEEVESAIAQVAELRKTVQSEALTSTAALSSLDKITEVQRRIVASRQQTDTAIAQIAEMELLRDKIMSGGSQTELAENSLSGMVALQKRVIAASGSYEAASDSIAELADLSQRLTDNNESLKVAAARFDEVVSLQNRMIASADQLKAASDNFEVALHNSAALAQLKSEIISGSEDIDVANTNARTLVAMNDRLSGNIKLGDADRNLDGLLKLESKLNEQSNSFAAAIENAELLEDLNLQLNEHVRSLAAHQTSLNELATLGLGIERVASIMEPLTKITSLRRLTPNELRMAARAISDGRSTRLSHSGSAMSGAFEGESPESDLVPLPPEARDIQ